MRVLNPLDEVGDLLEVGRVALLTVHAQFARPSLGLVSLPLRDDNRGATILEATRDRRADPAAAADK